MHPDSMPIQKKWKAVPTMKLFLLELHGAWIDWDEPRSVLVRATSSIAARKIVGDAAATHGYNQEEKDRKRGYWLDPDKADCVRIYEDGQPGILLMDSKEG